jgi:predicted dehydrogenase
MVERTGLIYMTGETSHYYPATLYCRQRFQNGDFGHFVYGEARYFHDMNHGFYEAFRYSGGPDWKRVAGFPPMFYPTHSVSMILSITGARVTDVSCLGWEDKNDDGIFGQGANLWNNPYSNETALMRTSDGGMCRINEFRRVGWRGLTSVQMNMFGTGGCFEEHAANQVWVGSDRSDLTDVTELLSCRNLPVDHHDGDLHEALQEDFYTGVSKVHPTHRLPKEFRGKPNGHLGSHHFLVDDFVKAVAEQSCRRTMYGLLHVTALLD